ncbi:class I SAM-dependent methyltransferase [Escherichia coli]|uniref:class I SAM-dependent methyltransferase n=13 Tax=Bacteria TaxID=2 RepID=UPI0032E7FD90
MKKNTDDGAKIYTPLTLKLYDWWVLGVSNRLAWGCPTKEHLLPHFLEHVGNNHLDIGVGTGFYLTHVPESSLISLMDLNEASLNAASTRAGESKIKHKISHDVFEPYPAALHGQFDSISMFYLLHCLPGNISTKSCVIRNAAQALTDDGTLYGATAALHGQFDSISMFYLLHCLPGNISTKSCVIRNAAQALTDDGTLYGATILGDGVVHNSFGQKLMRIYNQKGIFSNTKDSEEGLTHILSEHFENVKTKVQGTVVMFSASGKK